MQYSVNLKEPQNTNASFPTLPANTSSKSENQEINPLSPPSRAAVPREGVRGQHRCRRPAPAPRSRRCGIGGFSTLGSLILFLPLPVVVSEGEEDSHVCSQSFLQGWPRFPRRGKRGV